MKRAVLTVLLWAVSACVPVPQWQRGVLGDRRMQPVVHPNRDNLRQHVLSVREGAIGGHGSAGGGCGCD